mgnify:CR=1 FL=1
MSKLNAIAKYTRECNSTFKALDEYWANNQLVELRKIASRKIASRDVCFRDLSDNEKTIVYANYEFRYVLNGLVYEPTMNDSGDDVLPTSKRKALNQVENMQYRTLS